MISRHELAEQSLWACQMPVALPAIRLGASGGMSGLTAATWQCDHGPAPAPAHARLSLLFHLTSLSVEPSFSLVAWGCRAGFRLPRMAPDRVPDRAHPSGPSTNDHTSAPFFHCRRTAHRLASRGLSESRVAASGRQPVTVCCKRLSANTCRRAIRARSARPIYVAANSSGGIVPSASACRASS